MPFKGLNVSIGFQADTSKAKQQIQDLQDSLNKIHMQPSKVFDDVSLSKATQAASELQKHLQSAVNVDTGKLDLTKFSASLQNSKRDLEYYRKTLTAVGPAGEQAFLQLSKSISNAEAPTLKLGKTIDGLIESVKNVARYQFSTSILTSLTSSIQSAYSYAQDLNESLNKIQIVTGNSSDQMAKFAETANKAARELSTTTTAYTDAALIFFQQGLDEKTVKDRTDVVTKMAHATGDSASEVSSYMTAIWNNFDNGSESLEHYADVIAALGATTAASSSEIAEGLSKFASIAETTGLSYDYATAALATLVANTRQSADTIGNSLKTIFSRLQGLKLGETLEDGVDLNKYSKALKVVGVDVLDASGNMRDMDDILNDLASSWDILSDAQKTALAQTVGGTRQYTQLISLMDNWGDMQKNLVTAANSTGELSKQASIYEQSWQAAKDRVQASMEQIYSSLVDDKFFIGVDDLITNILTGVNDLINGFGGIKGILGTVGGIFMQMFAKEVPVALEKVSQNLRVLSGSAAETANKMQEVNANNLQRQSNDAISNIGGLNPASADSGADQTGYVYAAQAEGLARVADLKKQLFAINGTLSGSEKENAEAIIAQAEARYQIIEAMGQEVEKAQQLLDQQAKESKEAASKNADANYKENKSYGKTQNDKGEEVDITSRQTYNQLLEETTEALINQQREYNNLIAAQENAKSQLENWSTAVDEGSLTVDDLKSKIAEYIKYLEETNQISLEDEDLKKLRESLGSSTIGAQELLDAFNDFANSDGLRGGETEQYLQELDANLDATRDKLRALGMSDKDIEKIVKAVEKASKKTRQFKTEMSGAGSKFKEIPKHAVKASEAIASVSGALMSMSGFMNSVKSFQDVWSDDDATVLQKITATIGLLTTAISLNNAVQQAAQKIKALLTKETVAEEAVTAGETAVHGAATGANILHALSWKALGAAIKSNPIGAAISIIMALITVIIAAVSWIGKLANSENESAKAALDEAKSAKESVDASKEKVDALKDEVQAYKDAKKVYDEALASGEDITSSKAALDSAARALATAYEEEYGALKDVNVELLIAQGRYDELTEKINANRLAQVTKAKSEAAEGLRTASNAFTKNMQADGKDAGDSTLKGDSYSVEWGNGHLRDTSYREDYWISQTFRANQSKYSGMWMESDGDMHLNTSSDINGLIEGYETVSQLLDDTYAAAAAAGKTGELANSKVYQRMTNWLEKSREAYELYKSFQEEYSELNIEETILNSVNGIDLDSITSQDEYENVRKKAVDALAKSLEDLGQSQDVARANAEAAVDAYMQANIAVSDYANATVAANEAISQAVEDTGGKISQADISQYYKDMDSEDKKYFVKLNFKILDTSDGAESLQAQLDRQLKSLKENQDVLTIKAKAVLVNNAVDILAEDGAEALESSGIDWGKDGIIEFNEFLKKTKAEQIKYLKELSTQYAEELPEEVKQAQTAMDEEFAGFMQGLSIEDYRKLSDEEQAAIFTQLTAEQQTYVTELLSSYDALNSAQTENFSSLSAAKKLLSSFDSDTEKISFLKEVWDNDTESVREYQEAVLGVIKDSSQLSNAQKLKLLNEYITDETIKNSAEYKDLILDIAEAGEGMTLAEKIALINEQFDSGVDTAIMYGATIASIIASDKNSTSQQKIAALNEELRNGLITLEDYATGVASITDSNFTPTKKLAAIKQGAATYFDEVQYSEDGSRLGSQFWIEHGLDNAYRDEHGGFNQEAYSAGKEQARIDYYQNAIDSIAATDFTSIESLQAFMNALPEGVSMAEKLPAIFENLAGSVTSLEELEELTTYMESLGQDTTEATSIGLQAIASGYSSCSTELKAYQRALASGEGIADAEEALRAAINLEELAEKYGTTVDAIKTYKKISGETSDEAAAKALQQMSAAEDIAKNASKYVALSKKNIDEIKTSASDMSTFTAMSDAFKNFLGLEDLTVEQTTTLCSKLGEGKDAFTLYAESIGAAPEVAEELYDKLMALSDATNKGREGISDLNTLFADGKITAAEYRSAISSILDNDATATTAERIAALNEAVASGAYTADQYLKLIKGLINVEGKSSMDKLAEWDTVATSGKYKNANGELVDWTDGAAGVRAQKASIISSAKDMTFAQQEEEMKKLIEGAMAEGAVNEANSYRQKMLNIIKSSNELYDSEKLEKLNALMAEDASNAKLYKDAMVSIVKSSSQLTADEKIAKMNELFAEGERNGKEYADTMVSIIANDKKLTTAEKIEKINSVLNTENLKYYKDSVLSILNSDSSATTADKIALINDAFSKGLLTGKEYGEMIAKISDTNYTAFERLRTISENITDPSQQKAAAQALADSLKSNSFSSLKELQDFQSQLAGTGATISANMLQQMYTSIASGITSLDDLNELLAVAGTNSEAAQVGYAALAAKYSSCSDELLLYNQYIREGKTVQEALTASGLDQALQLESLAAEYGLTTTQIEAYYEHMRASRDETYSMIDAAKELARISAENDFIKNSGSYKSLGNQTYANIMADSSSVDSLSQAQSDFEAILGIENLSLEQTYTLLQKLGEGKEAFLSYVTDVLKLGSEEAENLYEKLLKIDSTHYDTSANSIAELIQAENDGIITSEEFVNILTEVLNREGTSTLDKITALNQALASGKITASEYRSLFESILGSSNLTALEKLDKIDELSNVVDAQGNRVYSDAQIRSLRMNAITSDSTMGNQWKYNQLDSMAQTATGAEEKYAIRQQQLSYINDMAGDTATKVSTLQSWLAEGTITAYQFGEALKSIEGIEYDDLAAALKEAGLTGKEYVEAMAGYITSDKSLTPEAQIQAIAEAATEAGVPLTDLKTYVDSILNSSAGTTIQQINLLNEALELGIITSEEYAARMAQLSGTGVTVSYKTRKASDSWGGKDGTGAENVQTAQAFWDNLSATDFSNFDELQYVLDSLPEGVDVAAKLPAIFQNLATKATKLSDVTSIVDEMTARGMDANEIAEAQQQGLIAVASQYSNCKDELEAYQNALNTGTAEEQAAARAALENAIAVEEAVANSTERLTAASTALSNFKSQWDEAKTAIEGVKSAISGLAQDPNSWFKKTNKELAQMRQYFKTLGLDWEHFQQEMNSGDSTRMMNAAMETQAAVSLQRREQLSQEKSLYTNASAVGIMNQTAPGKQIKYGTQFENGSYADQQWFKNLTPEVQGVFQEAIKAGAAKGLKGADLYEYVNNYFKDKAISIEGEIELNDAEFQDYVQSMYTAQVQSEQDAANETITIWENAYKTIADARSRILKGEAMEFASYTDFMTSYFASGAEDMNQYITALRTNNWDGLFQYDRAGYISGTVDSLKTGMGYDIFYDENGAKRDGLTGAGGYKAARDQYARQQGWSEDEIAAGVKDIGGVKVNIDALNEGTELFYRTILQAAGKTSSEIDIILAEARTGNEEAWNTILTAADAYAAGITDYATYQADQAEYKDAKETYQQAQTDFTNERSAWDAVATAIQARDTNGGSVYDNLGDNAESYLTTLGISREELEKLELGEVATKQQAAADKFSEAVTTFNTKVDGLTYKDALDPNSTERNAATAAGEEAQQTAATQYSEQALTEKEINAQAKALNMTTSAYKRYAETLKGVNKQGTRFNLATAEGRRAIYDYARHQEAATKATENFGKNQKENLSVLKEGKTDTMEYANAWDSVTQDLAAIFDTDQSVFTDDFIAQNMEILEDFQNGVEGSGERLGQALYNSISDSLGEEGATRLSGALDGLLTASGFESLEDIPVGFNIDDSAALESFQKLLDDGTMTAQELEAAMNAIGWDPEIEYVPVEMTEQQAAAQHAYFKDDAGNYVEWNGEQGTGSTVQFYMPKIKSATRTGTPKIPTKSDRRDSGSRRDRDVKRAVRYDSRNEKSVDDEIERYHKIKNELESINHELTMIGKEKGRAFGKDKLKAIEKETAALEKQKEAQEEYLKEIQAYAASDEAAARSIGLEIDAEGHVTNYELKMDEWINDYNEALRQANAAENDAVNWWNSLSADDQEKQENKDLYDEKVAAAQRISELAQAEYESRTGILSQYEETMDLLDKESETYQDIINSIKDAMLEKIQYVVQLEVQVSDNALQILKDYLEDVGDSADKASDALANFGRQAAQVQKQVSAYQTGIQNILGLAGADNDLINNALTNNLTDEDWNTIRNLNLENADIETLQEYEKSLLSLNQSLRELRSNALQKVTQAFNEYNTELEKHTAKIAHLQKVNQTYVDIIGVVGKKILDASGQLSDALNQANFEMQRNNTHALKSQLNFIDESIAETQKALKEAENQHASDETIKSLKNDIEEMQSKRDSVYESWLDSWKAECQAAADIYTATLESIVSTFEDQIAGTAASLSALSEEFNRQKTIDDTYLEEYDQIYQLSKLTRDINNSIDDTDNINQKKALKKLTQEIYDIQENGTDLSQYDLDALRAKYELQLAMGELEDARNAKTAVRMTRDAEGNYGYVYTADASEVEKAEQNYEDKLYAMQKLNSDYIDSMQNQIIQAETECSSALAALNASDYATYEEYQAAALQVQQDYATLVEDYYSQLENAIDNNKTLYEGAWSDYSTATGYQIDNEKEFITDFVDTQLARLTEFQTIKDATIAFNNALNASMNDSAFAWQTWYKNTQTAMADGGTTIAGYADTITEAVSGDNGLLAQSQKAENEAGKMAEEYETAFDDIIKSLKTFVSQWDEIIKNQLKNNQLLAETIYDIIAESAGAKAASLRGESGEGFDTGGYTGNWNSNEGRLAVLHQKEIVLNADDTSNLLAAVNAVRSFSSILDLNASAASSGLAGMLQSTGVPAQKDETLEQNVSITAEFKDATTANEITQAFDNLINMASQYANRKNV